MTRLADLYVERQRLVDELLRVDIEIGVEQRGAIQSQAGAMLAGPYEQLAAEVAALRAELAALRQERGA